MKVLGIMSGTSLDGVDIACCDFDMSLAAGWDFQISNAETIAYSDKWKAKLQNAHLLDGRSILALHQEYGRFLGKQVILFLERHNLTVDLIGSHGHTVFHEPQKGFTFQLGCGKAMWKTCKIPVVADFRTDDVLLGGQGAPLAPIGDDRLFDQYYFRLNLGGFSNISMNRNNRLVAFDICPVNYALNREAGKLGLSFDEYGKLAMKGQCLPELLAELNALDFYKKKPPKSLGREWMEKVWNKCTHRYVQPPENMLATFTEHITDQLSNVLNEYPGSEQVLLTGGGAKNTYLLQRLKVKTDHKIVVPDMLTVDYKEALIFAFMAMLKQKDQINVFASVTGATKDSSAGTWFEGK
ncbi:MAG: anhydro-N-acetylmuramic acid kinase [Bacteroidales bacterium]